MREFVSYVLQMMMVCPHDLNLMLWCLLNLSFILIVIVFRFEFNFYSFAESAGVLNNEINVVKQQGAVSEQTLTLSVNHIPLSAMFGEYIRCMYISYVSGSKNND